MKAKTIAKRLRARADEFHQKARSFQNGDQVSTDRARLLADVLQEVAEQVSPRPSKKSTNSKKSKKSKTTKMDEAKKESKQDSTNNGAKHASTDARMGIGVGG